MPSLYATQIWQAILALVLYMACFAAYVAIEWRQRRVASQQSNTFANTPLSSESFSKDACVTSDNLLSVFTEHGLEYLSSKGLTERELLVAAAHIQNLTAAQAGEAIGIAEPTVREYRRRCRKKLKIEDLSDLEHILPEHSLAHKVKARVDSHTEKRLEAYASYALTSLIATSALALLPYEGVVHTWSDVWTTPFGIGIGIAAAWFVRLCLSTSQNPLHIPRFIVACFLAISAVLLAMLRMGVLLPMGEGAFHKAWMLGTTAVFTACIFYAYDNVASAAN